MKVAFYKGKENWIGEIIRWWTKSPYSHCEMILKVNANRTYRMATSWIGVGITTRDRLINTHDWDFVDVPTTRQQDIEIIEWFNKHDGQRYDYMGILGFVIRRKIHTKHRWFCSEACAESLHNAGVIPAVKSWKESPGSLFKRLVSSDE